MAAFSQVTSAVGVDILCLDGNPASCDEDAVVENGPLMLTLRILCWTMLISLMMCVGPCRPMQNLPVSPPACMAPRVVTAGLGMGLFAFRLVFGRFF